MRLVLHPSILEGELSLHYKRAFNSAVELFVVTAYLTEWDATLQLNSRCRSFRVIVGRNFGITRKVACKKVMQWLPPKRKAQFLVADQIDGFHPKAVFWKETNGKHFAIVGSSNLTQAAFKSNYEANVFFPMSHSSYLAAKKWIKNIEMRAVVVSEDWLMKYKEARLGGGSNGRRNDEVGAAVLALDVPTPPETRAQIAKRRARLEAYKKKRVGLMRLFRRCATKQITPEQFYGQLPNYWSEAAGDRLQGAGYEIKGKHSNFHELSKSFVRIVHATDEDRDNVVSEEIDRLSDADIPTRRAFLSEMLCLRFPEDYPVLNQPVQDYLRAVKHKAPRGASEGARFIFLAKTLRSSLLQNPRHPAKSLAELDTVIWLAYGKKT